MLLRVRQLHRLLRLVAAGEPDDAQLPPGLLNLLVVAFDGGVVGFARPLGDAAAALPPARAFGEAQRAAAAEEAAAWAAAAFLDLCGPEGRAIFTLGEEEGAAGAAGPAPALPPPVRAQCASRTAFGEKTQGTAGPPAPPPAAAAAPRASAAPPTTIIIGTVPGSALRLCLFADASLMPLGAAVAKFEFAQAALRPALKDLL